MGNYFTSSNKASPPLEDYPYLWAIRDQEVLDWKINLPIEVINKMAREQTNLPVPIGKPDTRLFLGDAKCARNIDHLNKLNIKCIINVAGEASKNYDLDREYLENGMNILRLDAEDEEGYPMLQLHLETVKDQINWWAANKSENCNILIHCTAGINRSGLLVAALLLEKEKITVLDCVKHIRSRRGNCFLWNHSFQEQLVAHARKLDLLGEPLDNTPTNGNWPKGMFPTLVEKEDIKKRRDVSKLF
jgi:protein-tyrosine phosphatase